MNINVIFKMTLQNKYCKYCILLIKKKKNPGTKKFITTNQEIWDLEVSQFPLTLTIPV